MDQAQINEYFRLLDVAGQLPTKIDSELAAGRAQEPYVNSNQHVVNAHNETAKLGLALVDLEKWGKANLKVDNGGIGGGGGGGGTLPPVEVPPAVAGQLTAGQAQQKLPLSRNQIANWECMTDGRFSYAITPSGDGQAYWYVGSENLTDVNDPRWIGWMKGSCPWQNCKSGQNVSARYDGIDGQILFVDYYK